MERSDKTFAYRAAKIQSLGGVISGVAPVTASVASDQHAKRLALQWFAQMRTGRIDRAQLAAEYNAQLTEVKLVFPRGDAASLMFGLDAAGKITGVSLLSMAGD